MQLCQRERRARGLSEALCLCGAHVAVCEFERSIRDAGVKRLDRRQ
jgi:hypothetical protein